MCFEVFGLLTQACAEHFPLLLENHNAAVCPASYLEGHLPSRFAPSLSHYVSRKVVVNPNT
jgi:hypothetical protein